MIDSKYIKSRQNRKLIIDSYSKIFHHVIYIYIFNRNVVKIQCGLIKISYIKLIILKCY